MSWCWIDRVSSTRFSVIGPTKVENHKVFFHRKVPLYWKKKFGLILFSHLYLLQINLWLCKVIHSWFNSSCLALNNLIAGHKLTEQKRRPVTLKKIGGAYILEQILLSSTKCLDGSLSRWNTLSFICSVPSLTGQHILCTEKLNFRKLTYINEGHKGFFLGTF